MSIALRQPMTLQAFLLWEKEQPLRHEFDGLHPHAMTGGTVAHATIQNNLHIAIGTRLRGGSCRFFGSDLRVLTDRTSRYPDGLIACSSMESADTAVKDPVVIFEVLSRSTASTDHITKNREYASIPSVRRYVMLEQERIGATVFSRGEAGWTGEVLAEGGTLSMPEIGVELPLSELYDGLSFPPDDDLERPRDEA